MKKSYAAKPKSARVAKKPRLTLTRAPTQSVFKFSRLASSNANATNALPIQIKTDGLTGRPVFSNGSTSSANLQLRFSLATTDIFLNGLISSSFDMPGFSDFTNLFEEYRIDKVDIMVLPTYSSGNVITGTSANQLPWIVYVGDSTDVDGENSLELMQRQSAKFTQLTNNGVHPPVLCTVYPKSQAVLSGSSTPQAPGTRWVSTDDYGIPHYGFKMALDDSYNGYALNTTLAQLNFILRYHVSFKGVE